jgi:hypothetical protein
MLTAVLLLCAIGVEARERAVLVYPRERSLFRRVFYTSHQDRLVEKVRERYDVTVHEQVASAEELFSIDVSGASLLVLSAHGDPFSMYFAGRRSRTLDSGDMAELSRFFRRLAPDATIILQSCHTGRGFAHVVKQAAGPGRRVIAARGEIPWNGLDLTVAPLHATIHCRDGSERWDCTLELR